MRSITHLAGSYYTENNTRYVFIDGLACTTLASCYHTLQEQLSIPGYFGNNLDALEEVLADTDWIQEETIKIIILHEASLLCQEPAKKNVFLEILHAAGNSRIAIIYLGTTSTA